VEEMEFGDLGFLESVFGGDYFFLSEETFESVVRFERGEVTQEEVEVVFREDARRVAAIYLRSTGGVGEGLVDASEGLEAVNVLDVVKTSEKKGALVASLEHLEEYSGFMEAWLDEFFGELDLPVRINVLGDLLVLGRRGCSRYDRFVDAWSRDAGGSDRRASLGFGSPSAGA